MTIHSNQIFKLPKNTPIYIGRLNFVIEYTKGKDVLHLGCVDEGLSELKIQHGLWLHKHLLETTKSLYGVDVNRQGIEWMRLQGIPNLYLADIEEIGLIEEIVSQKFDLILLTEVLEHIDNPGKLLTSIRPLFQPETEMLVTVPNATSLANLIGNWQGSEYVHPDHNYWFSKHTVLSLFNKFGYSAQCIGVYSQHNFRRPLLKGSLRRLLHLYQIKPSAEVTLSASEGLQIQPNRPEYPWREGIQSVVNTLIYRLFLSRNPYFADGLIILVKPSRYDVDIIYPIAING